MKKLMFLCTFVLVVMALPIIMFGCSDNDDSSNSGGGNSSYTIVDGVNVVKGKKLSELKIRTEKDDSYYSSSPSETKTFKISYDNKGRLSDIQMKEDNNANYKDVARIDYDFRVIYIYNDMQAYWRPQPETYAFTLNDKGFISSIGMYSLTYDSNGYLIRGEERGEEDRYGIFAYDDNDIIKCLRSRNDDYSIGHRIYYVTYENSNAEGDLYIRVNYEMSNKYDYATLTTWNLVSFVAYQAGLFGKVTKSVIHLKDKNEASTIFDIDGNYRKVSGKISLIWR